ncbi:hypothetical protein [Micromonospora sp. NPDC006431]
MPDGRSAEKRQWQVKLVVDRLPLKVARTLCEVPGVQLRPMALWTLL